MSKVILITGASSGIGKAIGDFLCTKDFKVYGTSRNPSKYLDSKFQLFDLDVNNADSIKLCIDKIIKIDGGMVTNNWFAQFLSNILNIIVLRPVIQETTALGVAFLAGYQLGEFKSLNEIKNKWKKDAMFKPKMNKKMRNNLLQGWQQAIRKTLA